MITSRGWLRVATALVGLSAVLVPAAAPAAAAPVAGVRAPLAQHRALPEPPPADVARSELGDLKVESPHAMTGYSRARFPHWVQQGDNCDTREVVLKRDGQDVSQDAQCRAVSGTWFSEYDGKTLTAAGQIDVDHMVPLAAAWRAGADQWTTDRRKAFANDLEHSQLIAVSAASNRSKGDQTPDLWKPPLRSYWCTYSRAWIDVKHVYELTVTEAEQAALVEMLDTCDS
ncbi:HNH endonuclease family protein [Kitasatospora sp. NPDC050463]|uniref:HNH endonuclease family protein n=1 Tax=Kitasatospora sp. NPDC050463 TaxID=3155786 RepID=UPI0033EDCCF7